MKVNSNYDRNVMVSREEAVSLLAETSVTISAAIRAADLKAMAYVNTGKVGKPPALFGRAALTQAVAAYKAQLGIQRALRKSRKSVISPMNGDGSPANESQDTESSDEAANG